MKYLLYLTFLLLILSSCGGNSYYGKFSDSYPSDLQERIEELESELEDANEKIEEYQTKLDYIQSEASNGYDAICYSNWSYQIQEALDAFENIQNEAIY